MKDLIEKLSKITNAKANFDIGSTSWIGCGGKAEILISPQSIEELSLSLAEISKTNAKITILGARSNTIIRDGGIDGVAILLRRGFNEMKVLDGDKIFVHSGVLDVNLARFAAENNISGLEFLIGIPGSVGGNIAMNAGCYGEEIKDILESIDYVDFSGKIGQINAKDIKFEYRKAHLPKDIVITSAIFQGRIGIEGEIFERMKEIEEKRKKTQPIGRKTVGSTFKNPKIFTKTSFDLICKEFGKDFEHKTLENGDIYCEKIHSWMLIDGAGLRDFKIGGAKFSEIHCNFLINDGGATASDFENLGDFAIEKVFEKFGVKLDWEVKRIGKKL